MGPLMLKTVRRPAEICVARMEHVLATRDLRGAWAWLFVLKPPRDFFYCCTQHGGAVMGGKAGIVGLCQSGTIGTCTAAEAPLGIDGRVVPRTILAD